MNTRVAGPLSFRRGLGKKDRSACAEGSEGADPSDPAPERFASDSPHLHSYSMTNPPTAVHRFEVRAQPGRRDPKAEALLRDARSLDLPIEAAATARVYLIEAPLDDKRASTLAAELLADPVREVATAGTQEPTPDARIIEVHPQPGVMDPAAQSVRDAIQDLLGIEAAVSTGWRYDVSGLSADERDTVAKRLLANPVIHDIHADPFEPTHLPTGHAYELKVGRVNIRDLSDDELARLSRDAHLFLSLEEMQAIRAEYRSLDREPTDVELETLAQTWSEHCVHKTLKSNIHYRSDGGGEGEGGDPIDWSGRPGHVVNSDGSVTITNLLKSTVAAATFELIAEGLDWTLSVFVDNAGIIAFDDETAVCVKVETHNHPSAIEPYGGAATGIGGCIRDIIGTGLAAKPIASTDVFCVANPDLDTIPAGCLHPRRILTQVVAGVRDYGNRMGIPTVSGAVQFDDRYVGNPLVFCGCVGTMPSHLIEGDPRPGDLIVALGGRTGRDGIHGATFSSAELTDTHADEFSHAVQIGNAIEEKRVLDAILRARDEGSEPLFSSITDCGAGGFSSAVGEMGETLGAAVHLDKAPLKYAGLSYTEIWISEAQERMVLAVEPGKLDQLQRICDEEHVELAVLGTFGTPGADLILNYEGTEVGRMPMDFLHNGIPTPTREATWNRAPRASVGSSSPSATPASTTLIDAKGPPARAGGSVGDIQSTLLTLLSHPNIASKHFIIRQYDHEVQGNVVVKPLMGPTGVGPMDASVVEPVPGSGRGLAIACGLQTGIGDPATGGDPYLMTLAAIDECVRNLVCTGADPDRIAILDNFCWPSCGKPENLGSLVRAAHGCYDAAKAYRTPFVSGKDSLNNQFTTDEGKTIEIPPTLLITGIGIVEDVNKCVTTDARQAGNVLILVGQTQDAMGGSHYEQMGPGGQASDAPLPVTDLVQGPALAHAVAGLIADGLVRSAHDVSDGGILCAVAEMLIGAADDSPTHAQGGAGIGANLDLSAVHANETFAAFCESPSRYVLEVSPDDIKAIGLKLGNLPWTRLGTLTDSNRLTWPNHLDVTIEELTNAWRGTLDW
jgi:phosphoribosylformylglycinamidine synthase subunit PurSL